MKKILIASFFLITLHTQAQFSIGPVVGVGIQGANSYSTTSTITHSEVTRNPDGEAVPYPSKPCNCALLDEVTKVSSRSARLSVNAGVQAKLDIGKYFAISPSLVFQQMSSQVITNDVVGYEYLRYIASGVQLQGQYPINKTITIGLGAGPQLNCFIGGNSTKYSKIEAKWKIVQPEEASVEPTGYVKPIALSITVSPFVQFKFGKLKLLVSPTYYVGLTNILPTKNYTFDYAYENPDKTTTTYTTQIDEKPVSKTGGYGMNVSLLFGGK